jgi:hypothetical protein
MSRAWTEFMAAVFDVVPPALLTFLLLVLTSLVAALWYWYPAWVPRRLPRFRRQRRERPAKDEAEDAGAAEEVEATAAAEPAALPDPVPVGLADRLAAEGRYAEAIRERLRAVVIDLIRAGVIRHEPGQTVTELAGTASSARPAVAAPLAGATEIFSTVWYAQQPARAAEDETMKQLTGAVRQALPGGPR